MHTWMHTYRVSHLIFVFLHAVSHDSPWSPATICTCVCMRVCLYVCMYVCMHVCMLRHMCLLGLQLRSVHVCLRIYVYVSMLRHTTLLRLQLWNIHMYACMHACMYVCIHVYLRACVRTCMYVYIYLESKVHLWCMLYLKNEVCQACIYEGHRNQMYKANLPSIAHSNHWFKNKGQDRHNSHICMAVCMAYLEIAWRF
jgi:hypothetical protein